MVHKYNQGVADANRRRTKHGGAVNARQGENDPLYRLWNAVKDRCFNPKTEHYHRYGGRGITMCAAWVNDYTTFARDVGARPGPFYTLDRIDNDGDYEPNNVRWATRKEQANNRCTNTILTYEGKSMTLSQWADHLGLPYVVINSRWKKGRRPPELFMPRQTRVRNGLIEFDGKAMTLPEWASATGIPYPTLAWRLKHGKPLVPTEF